MMSREATTQMLMPSWRRVYTSRACSMAMRASAACTLPTCLCSSPARERMKTSNSGQPKASGGLPGSVMLASLCRLRPAPGQLFSVRARRLADPAARLPGGASRLQSLAVAGAIAPEYGVEFAPVDRPAEVVLRGLVPAQLRIGNGESEKMRLRHGHVDELLAQLIVAEALDLPAHGLRGVLGIRIAGAEHHDGRPPPAVERLLRHGALCR